MPIPASPDYVDQVITPTAGNVRAISMGAGRTAFQDPDMVVRRVYPDGSTRLIQNMFISREAAIGRLRYNEPLGRVIDSRGRIVGVGSLRLPATGRVWNYGRQTARWKPMRTITEGYRPKSNQEIIERLVLIDKDGRLRIVQTSYGRGRPYNSEKRGRWWLGETLNAAGMSKPEGRLSEDAYKRLQETVVNRQFILKTLAPTQGTLAGIGEE